MCCMSAKHHQQGQEMAFTCMLLTQWYKYYSILNVKTNRHVATGRTNGIAIIASEYFTNCIGALTKHL